MTEIIYLLVNLAGKGTDLSPYFGSYKDVYAFALIFVESLSEVAWIAGDLIIALISILLRRYYEELNGQLRSQPCGIITLSQLEEIRGVQLAISTLAQKVAEVFSPLILITIGCNVVYILTFLYSGLEADITSPSIFVRFVFTYSFIYIVLRLTFSVYLASLVNEMVKLSANILLKLGNVFN